MKTLHSEIKQIISQSDELLMEKEIISAAKSIDWENLTICQSVEQIYKIVLDTTVCKFLLSKGIDDLDIILYLEEYYSFK